jgi:hypothetical protein
VSLVSVEVFVSEELRIRMKTFATVQTRPSFTVGARFGELLYRDDAKLQGWLQRVQEDTTKASMVTRN